MSAIKAVLFDYGLVLSGPPDPRAWKKLKSLLGADETQLHAAYWKHRNDYDRGTVKAKSYWQSVGHDVGRTAEDVNLAELIKVDVALWTQPNSEMIDWALALRKAGYKIGILSNLGDAMEHGVLATCDWMRGFDHRTFSHRLGILKPDPEIYRHAAEHLGVSPAEILFIDDREENVLGATAAGMKAIRYTDHAQFVRDMISVGFKDLLSPSAMD